MIPSFLVQIILSLLVIGGAIAYIGNYVGKLIGKRRLSLFNMRPRYTATMVTVISGVLIAVSTFGFLLAISQDARLAVLGLEEVKKQISLKTMELNTANETLSKLNIELENKLLEQEKLTEELKAANKEVKSLQKVRANLTKEINYTRTGKVLFRVGEVIGNYVIKGGPEKDKIESGLAQILSAVEMNVREKGVKSSESLVYAMPEIYDQTVEKLLSSNGITIVSVIAARNVLWGEKVPVTFKTLENNMVFSDGTEIARLEIPKGLTSDQLEKKVYELLKESHRLAKEEGIIPDLSGSVGGVPYAQIADTAKKLKSYNNRTAILIVQAKGNIYSIGPLALEFVIKR
ncbi:MAG: DUF3084 domain-containing protein [Candidatus Margulisiibacteriota bacterium]